MKGYIARKRDRWYAVIYEGVDSKTGRERRRWVPAGTDRADAQALATQLGVAETERRDGHRSELTIGGFLLRYWLPAERLRLEPTSSDGYGRNVRLHTLPQLGAVPLRKLQTEQIEQLYTDLLANGNTRTRGSLSPKTVLEVHVILRAALGDAIRRGFLRDNPAMAAHAPTARRSASRAHRVWTADQLRSFLRLTADNRNHPAFWLAANTGMRRSELLGTLRHQLDVDQQRLSVSRTVVAVDYQIHESPGKTRSSRRTIDLDDRTMEILGQWQSRQRMELGKHDPNSPLFTRTDGNVIHPHSLSQAFERAVA